MVRMAEILEQLLDSIHRQIPLLFSVILPGWKDSAAWQKLTKLQERYGCSDNSKADTLRLPVLIAAADHGYVSGAQHQRRDRFLAAPFDTGVFVVGNSKGWEKFFTKVGTNDKGQSNRKRARADGKSSFE